MSELAVGETIWRFDENHRVYDKPGIGGRIVYKEHFVPEKITGETAQSWLVQWGERVVWKINKKTLTTAMKNGFHGAQFFTAEGMEENIWVLDHRHKIARLLEQATAANIRACGEILGYQP